MKPLKVTQLAVCFAVTLINTYGEEPVARLREVVELMPKPNPGLGFGFDWAKAWSLTKPVSSGGSPTNNVDFPYILHFRNDVAAWTYHSPFSGPGNYRNAYELEKKRLYDEQVFTVLTANECRAEFKDIRDKTSAALALAKTELITAVKEIPDDVLASPSIDLRMKKIARETADAQLEAREKTIVELKAAAEKQVEKIEAQAKQILEITEQLKDIQKRLAEKPTN